MVGCRQLFDTETRKVTAGLIVDLAFQCSCLCLWLSFRVLSLDRTIHICGSSRMFACKFRPATSQALDRNCCSQKVARWPRACPPIWTPRCCTRQIIMPPPRGHNRIKRWCRLTYTHQPGGSSRVTALRRRTIGRITWLDRDTSLRQGGYVFIGVSELVS